jgi:hypothetical protein
MSKIIKDFLKGFSKEELQAMEQAISENREEFLGVVQEKVEKKEEKVDKSNVQQKTETEDTSVVEKTKDTAQTTNVEAQKKTDAESEAERIARIVALTIKEMGILPKEQNQTLQDKKEEDSQNQNIEKTKEKTPNIGVQKQPDEKIGQSNTSFLNTYLKRN